MVENEKVVAQNEDEEDLVAVPTTTSPAGQNINLVIFNQPGRWPLDVWREYKNTVRSKLGWSRVDWQVQKSLTTGKINWTRPGAWTKDKWTKYKEGIRTEMNWDVATWREVKNNIQGMIYTEVLGLREWQLASSEKPITVAANGDIILAANVVTTDDDSGFIDDEMSVESPVLGNIEFGVPMDANTDWGGVVDMLSDITMDGIHSLSAIVSQRSNQVIETIVVGVRADTLDDDAQGPDGCTSGCACDAGTPDGSCMGASCMGAGPGNAGCDACGGGESW